MLTASASNSYYLGNTLVSARAYRCLAVALPIILSVTGCGNGPTGTRDPFEQGPAGTGDPVEKDSDDRGSEVDSALTGSWVSGVQTDFVKVYITELRFRDGNFEWAFDGELQQRGLYDTRDGVLTISILHNYGNPLRLLGSYSRSYSIVADTLMWGGSKFTRK